MHEFLALFGSVSSNQVELLLGIRLGQGKSLTKKLLKLLNEKIFFSLKFTANCLNLHVHGDWLLFTGLKQVVS